MLFRKNYFILKVINKLKYYFMRPCQYAKSIGVLVGNNTIIMTKSFGSEPYLITIGDNCEITANVNFVTHDGGVWVIRKLYKKYKNIDILKPIRLYNNIYIGNNTIVLPGVTISNNIIIGAGSIVTKSLKVSGVYAGIPCKYICTLDEYINKNEKSFSDTKQLNYFEKKEYYNEKSNGLQ